MFYTFNVVFTLLMIAMLIVAASPRVTRRLAAIGWIDRLGEVCAKTIRRYYWILFALVLTAGVFVRVWRFGHAAHGPQPGRRHGRCGRLRAGLIRH